MPLEIEPLEEGTNFDSARKSPQWIVGENQTISWRNCFVNEYITGNSEDPQKTHERCTGRARVPKGTDVFLYGSGGKVKT